MALLRIKFEGEKYGAAHTAVPGGRAARDLTTMNGEELAQLALDLWLEPQPAMRRGEAANLLGLVCAVGRRRYGELFGRLLALQLLRATW